ncbi:MAG: hypothetical protein OZ921_15580 [Sorangiineae bacterium]|nr:hypothetical protein [Polyangiaceae bacterium]MEB2323932.1 hypothetical protein [Sorangiineae bacterium]
MATTVSESEIERELIEEITREFPRFRLVPKRDDRLSRVIDRLLRVLTLGGQRAYLTRYHTVLFDTLYLPESWDETAPIDRVIVLRHERVHLRQRRRLGTPLFSFAYLVPLLPLGLAWGRARLEWEAYAETLRATAELKGLAAARAPELRGHIVGRFTGPEYGWMWPFTEQVERWYDRVIGELERESARDA